MMQTFVHLSVSLMRATSVSQTPRLVMMYAILVCSATTYEYANLSSTSMTIQAPLALSTIYLKHFMMSQCHTADENIQSNILFIVITRIRKKSSVHCHPELQD